MDEKGLRELLMQRLHMELQIFKDSMLLKDKEDIFAASYKIEIYVNLYEIFVEQSGTLKKDTMRGLLNLKCGILESFYQEWINWKDGLYDELSVYVCDRLELISVMIRAGNGSGKEGEDGAGYDKAA